MKNKHLTVLSAITLMLVALSFEAWGASTTFIPLDSLVGKFAGTIQVDKPDPVPHEYQTEVTAVDKPANTVTLSASCLDCGIKKWNRNKCEIKEAKERIRFVCKGPKSDEEYTFDGKEMKAVGFGNNYPYSISVSKI
jgi:hypothetical protein